MAKKTQTPDLPIVSTMNDLDIDASGLDSEGFESLQRVMSRMTETPDGYVGEAPPWRIPRLTLVHGQTKKDGVRVPTSCSPGAIVYEGREIYAADAAKKDAPKFAVAVAYKTYTYFPEYGSEERIRSVFPKTYYDHVPEHEKRYEENGFKTKWRRCFNYVLIPIGQPELGIVEVQFSKSASKNGANLDAEVRKWIPMYKHAIGLYSETKSGSFGDYFVLNFTADRDMEIPADVRVLAAYVQKVYAPMLEARAKEEYDTYASSVELAADIDAESIIDVGGDAEDEDFTGAF